jgi:hypothetical protein
MKINIKSGDKWCVCRPPPKLSMNQLAASKAATVQKPASPLTVEKPASPQTTQSLLDADFTPSPVLLPTQNLAPPVATSNHTFATPTPAASSGSVSLIDNDDGMFTDMVSAPVPAPSQELLPLTDVLVPLESIKPGRHVIVLVAH